MFKNALFLKIILIFTLPALGILYFSSILVYEKIQSFNEVDGINNNLVYLKSTEKLLDSLQEERELSVIYILQKKDKEKLDKTRVSTNQNYLSLKESLEKLSLDSRYNQLRFEIQKLDKFRQNVDSLSVSLYDVFEEYSDFNKMLLDSISFLKPIKLAFDFNSEFRNIVNFLNFKEANYIEKTIVLSYFMDNKMNEKIYNMLMKSYSLQEINKNYFLNNTNIEIVQKYSSKLNEEYFSKILFKFKSIPKRP